MPSPNEQALSWLALGTVPHIGPVRYRHLLDNFGTPEKALAASVEELRALEDFGPKMVEALKRGVDWKKAEEQVRLMDTRGVGMITLDSAFYPERLKNIYDPPPYFFYAGELECLALPAVAIVGSRVTSQYGRRMAEKLATDLVTAGLVVASGFARGIDTIAHRTAIAQGGRTVAVFGCGLDVIYPPENKELYRSLVLNGCALSEFYLGDRPEPVNFPKRNRIISGLCLGVVVVEAGAKSGALLTARHALEQGREVFAVPGNITSSTSQGTNEIIKRGAKLVTSAEDVLEELKFLVPRQAERASRSEPRLQGNPRKIYELLTSQPLHVDKIVAGSGLPVSEVLELLLDLELAGLVDQLSGKMFTKHI